MKNWDDSSPSTWLTAWVLRLLSQASFQDWEDFLYIDPQVITSGVLWLLNYQTESGAFLEFGHYRSEPLHRAMMMAANDSSSSGNGEGVVALTAHVLITLEETMPMLKASSGTMQWLRRKSSLSYFLYIILPNIPVLGFSGSLRHHGSAEGGRLPGATTTSHSRYVQYIPKGQCCSTFGQWLAQSQPHPATPTSAPSSPTPWPCPRVRRLASPTMP